MHLLTEFIAKLLTRVRYPVSLPQEIAQALGIQLNNSIKFHAMLSFLTHPSCKVSKLYKFMPREIAEIAFLSALKKERFGQKTFFIYYFSEGWLQFELQFDEQSKLRRLYIHHKLIRHPQGHELQLGNQPEVTKSKSPFSSQINFA